MKKNYYIVTTFIKWKLGEGYRRNEYKYLTKAEQKAGFDKISADLSRLINNGTILDFQVEANL